MLGSKAWSLVHPLVELVCRLGLDRRRVLRRLGVSNTDLAEQRIPIDRVFALWADAVHTASDLALPLKIGNAVRLDDLQLMGFAIMTAPTGHEALARAIRYSPLIADSGRWRADAGGDRITVRWLRDGDRSLGHRIANESGLAQFVGCLRQICGPAFAPAGVHFRHRAPASAAHHRAYFRCAVDFAEADDAFWFDRRVLDSAPAAVNPRLAAFVREHAEARLRSHGASPAAQARDAIERTVGKGERPSATAVAGSLGLAERTLRRRLRAGGASFSELVDDVLRERARTLVAEGTRPLTDVALELGFSDTSAFSHAFKRWFGDSPREVRRAARSAAA